MHQGRQSNGRLPPVLVVWVVHFAKKIDQPPTLGLKAQWLLQERCAAVSREPGVVHAPELRCGVRGRPPGVYQPAPRVHQTLMNITKKFLHEPNPNPQSETDPPDHPYRSFIASLSGTVSLCYRSVIAKLSQSYL